MYLLVVILVALTGFAWCEEDPRWTGVNPSDYKFVKELLHKALDNKTGPYDIGKIVSSKYKDVGKKPWLFLRYYWARFQQNEKVCSVVVLLNQNPMSTTLSPKSRVLVMKPVSCK